MNHFFCLLAVFCSFSAAFLSADVNHASPEVSLQRLVVGNLRYSQDKSTCPDRNLERRMALSSKQEPFAVIVGCSDSRVSPEIVFDQGVGDLFIVRTAGNLIGPLELESIKYSVVHLHSSVIVVLGHEGCGAVAAVLEGKAKNFPGIFDLIDPVVATSKGQPGNRLDNAIKDNVRNMIVQLKKAKWIQEFLENKKVIIVGAYYNLHSGLVEILE